MRNNIEAELKSVIKVEVPRSTFVKVENVLRNLEHKKDITYMKPGYTKSAFIAAALTAVLLVTTTALAVSNSFGILDYLNSRINSGAVLPDATKTVQGDVFQNAGQNESATFAVREAIFDGSDVYIVFAVKPEDQNLILIALDYTLDDPVAVLGSHYAYYEGTIDEYATANNKRVVWVGIGGLDGGWDCRTENDGTLVIIASTYYSGIAADALGFELPCFLIPMPGSTDTGSCMPVTTLSFVLHNSGHFYESSATPGVEFFDVGVRIDNITLSASEISVNVRIEYTVVDQKKFDVMDGGFLFELLSEKYEGLPHGYEQRLPNGPGESGGVTPLDSTNTRFAQEENLAAMEVLPAQLIIRGFNYLNKARYETHIVEIHN